MKLKNGEKKEFIEVSSPSTSSEANSVNEKKRRALGKREDEDYRKRRKRKKSASLSLENTDKDSSDWQKPCSSGLGNKVDSEEGRITINDLFGEDSNIIQRDSKMEDKACRTRSVEEPKEKRCNEWKKEEGESPDSGFVDESMDSDRERQTQHLEIENVLEELGHVSPLLSPVRKPTRLPPLIRNGSQKSLKCELNLSIIESSERERLLSKLYSMENAVELIPRPQLSPPPRPSSRYSRSPCMKTSSPYFPERTSSPRSLIREMREIPFVFSQQNRVNKDVSGQMSRKSGRSPLNLRKEILKKDPLPSPRHDDALSRSYDGYVAKDESKLESVSPTPSISPLPTFTDHAKDQENETLITSRTSPYHGINDGSKREIGMEDGSKRRSELSDRKNLRMRSKEESSRVEKRKEKEKSKEAARVAGIKGKELREQIRPEEVKKQEKLSEETHVLEERGLEKFKEEKNKQVSKREKKEDDRFRLQREAKAIEKEKLKYEKEAKLRGEKETRRIEEKNGAEKDSKRKDKTKPEKKENREKDRSKSNTSNLKAREGTALGLSQRTRVEERERNFSNSKLSKKDQRESFVCCADKVERRKSDLELDDDRSLKSASFYEGLSRPKKHRADEEKDRVLKVLYYFDSIVYFILTAAVHSRNRSVDSQGRQFALIRDIAELLKNSTNRFLLNTADYTPLMLHYIARVKIMSLRTQAVLNFQLFSLKRREVYKNVSLLAKFEPKCRELEALARRSELTPPNGSQSVQSAGGQSVQSLGSQSVHSAATPSPASSSHSVGVEKVKEITLPLAIFKIQKSQLMNLNHLLWAHKTWEDANAIIGHRERDLVERLDEICGSLSVESSLECLSLHLATGVSWLISEYNLETDTSSRV